MANNKYIQAWLEKRSSGKSVRSPVRSPVKTPEERPEETARPDAERPRPPSRSRQ